MHVQNPLVSIAMATYNGEKYLGEQLESIIGQTYPNIEIVIVDDGSSDNTLNIIKQFQEKHTNIHLFQNEKNLGVTKTFEKAAFLSKGKYVAFSDQDDIWMLNKIQALINKIDGHDAAYGNSMLVDANGRSLNKPFSSMMVMKSYYTGASLLLSNTVPGHGMLVNRQFLLSLMPFPDNLFFDLWIAFNAAANNGIVFVDEILVHYRQHDFNVVGTRHSKNKRKKETVEEQFLKKKAQLFSLASAPVKDETTKMLINQMIGLFNRKWSLKRSLFFFKHFNILLASKKKPHYRKILYCFKMFFKPNF